MLRVTKGLNGDGSPGAVRMSDEPVVRVVLSLGMIPVTVDARCSPRVPYLPGR
jgi:hypothetical protein